MTKKYVYEESCQERHNTLKNKLDEIHSDVKRLNGWKNRVVGGGIAVGGFISLIGIISGIFLAVIK